MKSKYVTGFAPTDKSVSTNAFVKRPLPFSSWAASFMPHAAKRTCDLKPACRNPGAIAEARCSADDDNRILWSRSRGIGKEVSTPRMVRKEGSAFWRVPEPE